MLRGFFSSLWISRVACAVMLCMFTSLVPYGARAQEAITDTQTIIPVQVARIVHERLETVPGTSLAVTVQTIEARDDAGAVFSFEHDLSPRLEVGQHIFIKKTVTTDGDTYITFHDHDRLGVLLALTLVCIGAFVLLIGKRSWRALLSLAVSLGAIFFLLVPALAAGYPVLPLTVSVAGGVLALAIFLTHGWTRHAGIAFAGTMGAVVASSLFAAWAVSMARFSGTGSDAAVYLNVSTNGGLDLPALLLASIIIGMLGVLDDIAITQVSVTEELAAANPAYGFRTLYHRAMRVGHDHVSALVNTLALAYVGTSLPLVLLLSLGNTSITMLLNQEMVADEIVRLLVGTCGLMLTVPLTTGIAAWWYARHGVRDVSGVAHHQH